MIHAVVVLLALVLLSSVLAYLPMASMAALLMVVAWNMSAAAKALHLVKRAPRSDVLVFAVCFSLTVMFDMVIAITAGIVLVSLLFMKEIAEMTRIHDITENKRLVNVDIPHGWKIFKIHGPLFFAAADRVFGELALLSAGQQGIVLYLDGVSILDSGGVNALNKFLDNCKRSNIRVYLADFQYQPLKTLSKAGFRPDGIVCETYASLGDALNSLSILPAEASERA